MKFQKALLASAVSLVLFGLASCGDADSQDEQEEDETSFTGLVIDGRVAGGTVWADLNNNNVMDTFEPYAITDSDGYYSYNPLTNTNYCLITGNASVDLTNSRYCLRFGSSINSVIIRISGGTDISTGESFAGLMGINTSIDTPPTDPVVLSPLTTLLLDIPDDTSLMSERLNLIGIDSTADNVLDLINTDYTTIPDTLSPEEIESRLNLFSTAVTVQQTLNSIATSVDAFAESNGLDLGLDDDGNPGIGSSIVLANQQLVNLLQTNNADLTDPAVVEGLIRDTANGLSEFVDQPVPTPTEDFVSSSAVLTSIVFETANENLQDVTTLEELNTGILSTQVVSSSISSLIENTSDITPNTIDTIERVAETATDADFLNNLANIINNNQTLDILQLSDDLTEGDDVNAALENSTLAEAPAEGDAGIWAQRVLSLSGESSEGERGRALIFFSADSDSATQGEATVCYAFNANDNDDDVEPTVLTGNWSEIGTQRGIVKINQDLVEFTVKAFRQEPIPADEIDNFIGLTDEAPNETDNYGHFRFATDDRQEIWFSDVQVIDTSDKQDFGLAMMDGSAPTTSQECASYTVNGVPNALTKNLGL